MLALCLLIACGKSNENRTWEGFDIGDLFRMGVFFFIVPRPKEKQTDGLGYVHYSYIYTHFSIIFCGDTIPLRICDLGHRCTFCVGGAGAVVKLQPTYLSPGSSGPLLSDVRAFMMVAPNITPLLALIVFLFLFL